MTILRNLKKLKVFSHDELVSDHFMKHLLKISESASETQDIGRELGVKLSSPVIVGLSGEMGTGKTVFTKGFAHGLGVKELITSPTFLGVSEYYSGRMSFVHMDFYKKVTPLKIIKNFFRNGAVILIEWFENYSIAFNEKLETDIRVYIQYLNENGGDNSANKRKIIIESGIYDDV